jgi:phage-related protein
MARTQAVYYRDERGSEPVAEFIAALPSRDGMKVRAFIREYLNGKAADLPPPDFPITSQLEGGLRELRIRFGGTRYRVIYQRSRNLLVLLHALKKNTAPCRRER